MDLNITIFILALLCQIIPLVWCYRNYKNGRNALFIAPIAILVVMIFMGTFLKVFYIEYIRPENIVALLGYTNDDRVLAGNGNVILLYGTSGILLSIILLLIGYSSIRTASDAYSNGFQYKINDTRLRNIVIILLAVTLVSFGFFYYDNSLDSAVGDLSLKRFNSIEGGATNRLNHIDYYLYKVATFVKYGFYLMLILVFSRLEKIQNKYFLFLLIFLVLSIFISSYFGNRSHIVSLLLDVTLFYLVFKSKINRRIYCTVLVVSVLALLASTIHRESGRYVSSNIKQVQSVSQYIPDNTLASANDQHDLYHKCRTRVGLYDRNYRDNLSQHYWAKKSIYLIPNGTNQETFLDTLIDKLFNQNTNIDLCSGRSLETNPSSSTVYSNHYLAYLLRVDAFIQGGYFIDVLKTSHIIKAVPTDFGYLHGQSLVGWLFAPVPRSVWPNKPLFMNLPPILSTLIYSQPHNNIPPGIVAELYLNFGWLGVVFGMLLLGIFLRFSFNYYVRYKNSIFVQTIYVLVITRFTIILFNSSMGAAILKTIIDVVPLFILLFIVIQKERNVKS